MQCVTIFDNNSIIGLISITKKVLKWKCSCKTAGVFVSPLRRTVPFASVEDASMPQPNTMTCSDRSRYNNMKVRNENENDNENEKIRGRWKQRGEVI